MIGSFLVSHHGDTEVTETFYLFAHPARGGTMGKKSLTFG